MKKLGVFICHCGVNIAGTVDVKTVAEKIGKTEDVAHSTDYIYMCSEPGQQTIREAIREKGLTGVVVACCSPNMHENTFRKAVKSQGMNPYLCEIANIREQCSWVHQKEKEEATRKAEEIIRSTLEKVRRNESLEAVAVAINRRVLVVGGGIAGITASLDLAEGGYEVILLEREPALGGHMAQLSKTFPDLDPAFSGFLSKALEVEKHPKIQLHCYSELEDVKGFVGNFDLVIRQKATSVDGGKCNGCGLCIENCPVEYISEFERGMGMRKAIDTLYPGSVPNKAVINREQCRYFLDGSCRRCEEVCPEKAIDFQQEDQRISEKVGAVVVATGFELYPKEQLGEYGCGEIPDVIDGLAFERMLSPNGPTKGKIIRPSDGKIPKEMVFIQCVASRDPDRYMPYCSRICCMYTAKHAKIYKEQVPDGQPYIFYMDIRSDCKGYEEFLQKTVEEKGLLYLRGRVSRVFQEDGKVRVLGVDTLTGKMVEVAADMVILATAIVPSNGVKELAAKLRATVDRHGFLTEAHIKLYPVESSTKGIYLAGCGQSPKDISDTVSQASATASKIQALLSTDKLLQDPLIAFIDEGICSGCGICVEICPYEARDMDPHRGISIVHGALCQGCGACIASCPNFACELRNSSSNQILKMVDTFVT
ncbi:MAG TPA: CoB--CoM heterodisulfide reductase iron-sulfur subunit A family protein [Thermodesulfobacteriota bacterium]|nr:CoB--CoM heterodisulfide reductase iron-sulfur subunit A family protein [Thermodesulfobacteriota bacterium]